MFTRKVKNKAEPNRQMSVIYQIIALSFDFLQIKQYTVKLGYNELGYNEQIFFLVGSDHFYDDFSRLLRSKPGYNEHYISKNTF